MKKLQILLFLCLTALASAASADRYEVVELGPSPVAYIEHRSSVNDSSQVAWTTLVNLDGSHIPRARLTDASTRPLAPGATRDLHALLMSAGGSYASDTVSRAEDLNNDGDVVGYAATTALEARRHAALWFAKDDGTYQVIDLHQALVTVDPDGAGSYDISAAYGVSERIRDYVFVAGYRRSTIAALPSPTVWRVKLSDRSVTIYTLNANASGGPGTGYNYGLAYDVAARMRGGTLEISVGAGIGGQAPGGVLGGAYLFAYYFRVNGANGVVIEKDFVPSVSASTHATSNVNRVEAFDLDGPDGDPAEFYFAGYALKADGQTSAFVWKRGDATADIGGRLTSGDISIGLGLSMRTDAGAVPNQPQVLGSSTVGAGGVGVADGSTPLRGFYGYVEPAANLGRMCNLSDEVPAASSDIEVATDMSGLGVVVGWSGTQAVVALPEHGDSPELKFYKRSNSTPYNDPVEIWWVEMDGVQRDVAGNAGQILFSDEPGCYGMSTYCDGGNLSLNTPLGPLGAGITNSRNRVDDLFALALDNSAYPTGYPDSAAVAALSTNMHWLNTASSSFEPNRFDPALSGFAQGYAIDRNGVCQVTDVYDLSDPDLFEVNPCNEHTDGWQAPRGVYRDCLAGSGGYAGCETDITNSRYYCGGCDLPSSQRIVDDRLWCTDDSCVDGVKTNTLQPNLCLIDGRCRQPNYRNYWSYVTATEPEPVCQYKRRTWSAPNPCQICDPSSSTSGFTNTGPTACCQNGIPKLDPYDTANNQGSCGSRLGADRNDGRTWVARWNDPRGYNGRYQANHDWNNGSTCNVGTTTGKVRRIDAYFTPYVDTSDWYATRFDDDSGGKTPEPRARLISRDGHRMELCLYIDCVDADAEDTEVKKWEFRGGTVRCSADVCNPGDESPAWDARGICRRTDDNGVADIEIYDYDCKGTSNEDAYVHVVVNSVGSIGSKMCNQMDYTLYYGNDSEGDGDSGSGGRGCAACCN